MDPRGPRPLPQVWLRPFQPASPSPAPAFSLKSSSRVTRLLLPRPAPTGPPGPAFFAAPVVLLHSTRRVDGEPHVDAAPVPWVQTVEQVDAEEASGAHRLFGGRLLGPVTQGGLGCQGHKMLVSEKALGSYPEVP